MRPKQSAQQPPPTPLDNAIANVSAEDQHLAAINDCFLYFAALAETRQRGAVSDLFDCFSPDIPKDCDEATAVRLHQVITEFIEKCGCHPNIGSCFRTLLNLSVGQDLKSYFISKLRFYYRQGDAFTVYQLCTVLEDCGLDVFRDESGAFIPSRGSCEAEQNMGVARRFLERYGTEPSALNGGPPMSDENPVYPGGSPLESESSDQLFAVNVRFVELLDSLTQNGQAEWFTSGSEPGFVHCLLDKEDVVIFECTGGTKGDEPVSPDKDLAGIVAHHSNTTYLWLPLLPSWEPLLRLLRASRDDVEQFLACRRIAREAPIKALETRLNK